MRVLLLFIAAVVAILAGLAALQLSDKPAPVTTIVEHSDVSTVDVLVARSPIAIGTAITEAMIDFQPWPENLVLKNFIVRGSPDANIVGKITHSAFQAREPLIASKLANSNDAGFLAASLPAGMRAVTVAVNAEEGVAGFVYPGDHVDVIFTHNTIVTSQSQDQSNNNRVDTNKPAFAEVLISNVLVLAINTRDGSQKPEGPTAVSNITLQVNMQDVQSIRLAEKVGTLSLSLRSASDAGDKEVAPPADLEKLTRVRVSGESPVDTDTVSVVKR